MKILKITGKYEAPHVINDFKITHALSLLDPYEPLEYDPSKLFHLESHTRFDFRDVEWTDYDSSPKKNDCEKVLEWGKQIPEEANVLIHCHAGISRSTCSALAIMIQRYPNRSFEQHKNELIRIRPIAFPNKLMASYFDELMNFNGNFLKLVNDIHNEQDAKFAKERNGYLSGVLG